MPKSTVSRDVALQSRKVVVPVPYSQPITDADRGQQYIARSAGEVISSFTDSHIYTHPAIKQIELLPQVNINIDQHGYLQ